LFKTRTIYKIKPEVLRLIVSFKHERNGYLRHEKHELTKGHTCIAELLYVVPVSWSPF